MKEDDQVWWICFLKKKTGSRASVNEQLRHEVPKPVIKKKSKEGKTTLGLKKYLGSRFSWKRMFVFF